MSKRSIIPVRRAKFVAAAQKEAIQSARIRSLYVFEEGALLHNSYTGEQGHQSQDRHNHR